MSLRILRQLLVAATLAELGLSALLLVATFAKPADFSQAAKVQVTTLVKKDVDETPTSAVDYDKLESRKLQAPLFDPPPTPIVTPPPLPLEPPQLRVLATFTGNQAQAMLQNQVGATYIKNIGDEIDTAGGTVKIINVTASSVSVQFNGNDFDLKLESTP